MKLSRVPTVEPKTYRQLAVVVFLDIHELVKKERDLFVKTALFLAILLYTLILWKHLLERQLNVLVYLACVHFLFSISSTWRDVQQLTEDIAYHLGRL